MPKPERKAHPIFIAAHDAVELRKHLLEELGAEVSIGCASNEAEVSARYAGEPVVLGQPDFVAALMKNHPPVTWVQSTWAGVKPLVALGWHDYRLTSLKGVFGGQMAEYVIGYLLAHELKIQQRSRSQQQHRWDDTSSGRLRGKVLGVMGTGSIGCRVAEAACHFAITPIGFNTDGRDTVPFEKVYGAESLHEFLARCDYLFTILPDTPATTDLLDEKAFAVMKPAAVLINGGRGNVLDEPALCRALREGRLAGAVLDVFREEPLPQNSPLWDTPNLLITGHVAAKSYADDIVRVFLENYRLFCSGEPLRYQVDFNKGY